MPKVHSHYENLKVARAASAEDIRAAYRALTRKHHPDRNPDNADAERVMAVINVAYGVLGDPAKRSEHDRWIARTEAAPVPLQPTRLVRGRPTVHVPIDRYLTTPAELEKAQAQRARQARVDRRVRRTAAHLKRHRASYGLAGIAMLCAMVFAVSSLHAPGFTSNAASAPSASAQPVADYVRAASAPNGERWPAHSGYIAGYGQMNQGGLSEITVDNTHNDIDMFVKLVSLDGTSPAPVRTFFVSARSRFTLAALTTGTYDLRYRNLASGGLARSPALILEEVTTARGTQHSALTVKLYQSADGSLQAYALGDADF